MAAKNEYVVVELIECPACEGDGNAPHWGNAPNQCLSCQGAGEMPLPETALQYLELRADSILAGMETGAYDGSTPHDMAQTFVRIVQETKKLYGD